MCTEYITKHRLFPKGKTEFYKVLVKTEDSRYFSPHYCTEYTIGERVEAFLERPGLPVTDNYRLSPYGDGCDIAIHLFENKADAKDYAKDYATEKHILNVVLGVIHCDPDDFFCCGLTRSKSTWLPTACYNAATLVRVEEIDEHAN